MIDPHAAKLVLSGGVETVGVGDDLVVVDRLNGLAHALDSTAAFIWSGLADGLTLADIVVELASAFDAPADVIAADVSDLVLELRKQGVMSEGEGDDPLLPDPDDVGAEDCAAEPVIFDDRYLAAPPNH